MPRVSVQWRGSTYVGRFTSDGSLVTVWYDHERITAEVGDCPPGVQAWLTLVCMVRKRERAGIRVVPEPVRKPVGDASPGALAARRAAGGAWFR